MFNRKYKPELRNHCLSINQATASSRLRHSCLLSQLFIGFLANKNLIRKNPRNPRYGIVGLFHRFPQDCHLFSIFYLFSVISVVAILNHWCCHNFLFISWAAPMQFQDYFFITSFTLFKILGIAGELPLKEFLSYWSSHSWITAYFSYSFVSLLQINAVIHIFGKLFC